MRLPRKPRKPKPGTIYAGSLVRVIDARCVVRVGYPKSFDDYRSETSKLDAEIAALMTAVGSNHGRLSDKIRRAIAYEMAKADGWGGRERSLHLLDVPEAHDQVGHVQSVRRAVTGTYCPASGSGPDYYGEYDYEPAGLDNARHWRLATVFLSQVGTFEFPVEHLALTDTDRPITEIMDDIHSA